MWNSLMVLSTKDCSAAWLIGLRPDAVGLAKSLLWPELCLLPELPLSESLPLGLAASAVAAAPSMTATTVASSNVIFFDTLSPRYRSRLIQRQHRSTVRY